jgi:alkaline phosphatase
MNLRIIVFPIVTILSVVFLGYSCNRATAIAAIDAESDQAKNIIFLIGDGMGLGQITGGMIANGMQTNLEKFPITGLHKSYASNDLITDSAAGATAFSTGEKTYNGAIGVDVNQKKLETILEVAKNKGLKTGLVATSTIVHATPASFFSHNISRLNYEAIALDFLDEDVDFFIGGGKKYFDRRSDERNLYTELGKKGYQISDYFKEELKDVVIKSEKFGYLTSDDSPLTVMQGRDYLPEATKIALDFLSERSEKGFFLMVESSQIDWGGHSNNADYIQKEFKEFDKVIGSVLDWAKKDKNTLVVVTADHETGGYTINPGSTPDSLVIAFTTDYHTGIMIPVFAYGPGAQLFSGIYENTAIYDKMRKAFGWAAKFRSRI